MGNSFFDPGYGEDEPVLFYHDDDPGGDNGNYEPRNPLDTIIAIAKVAAPVVCSIPNFMNATARLKETKLHEEASRRNFENAQQLTLTVQQLAQQQQMHFEQLQQIACRQQLQLEQHQREIQQMQQKMEQQQLTNSEQLLLPTPTEPDSDIETDSTNDE